ncbi:alpha-ketoglutarate-dependent dioxygenase AlkB family protein [Rhodococcus baikonurensis]|uniref:alpha-ketoglutarate-dependent dioxygenase AlkB family protein n=1 Tax=Rhodococcus baikonurensis TaxID=172041 RepID=UPI0037B03B5E
MNALIPRPRMEVAPGAILVPDWLSIEQQRRLVAECRRWATAPVPMRSAVVPGGHKMSVQTVCLGWHWQPYKYTRTADDVNGAPVAAVPDWLVDLGRTAVASAYGDPTTGERYTPDTALINFYEEGARMGMHQDKDERCDAPVVSLSVGQSCILRFGNSENRNKPYTDVELHSGDLFVFGGESRFAYHGVPKVIAGSASPDIGLPSGRLNITLRDTGMS